MKHETIENTELSYAPCRYGQSRMLFRGPRKRLDAPYLAFLGGTETYGKYIEKPFPVLIEKAMRQPCVNFGCVNGGIDAVIHDPTVMNICAEAELTVVQVMGANNLSNRFYSVHPRRNDRFVQASTVLQAIYQDVDFSDFNYTRDMLNRLHSTSIDRFETVVEELRNAWMARMRDMLQRIGANVILLWFSEDALNDDHWSDRPNQLQVDPLFVTASMIDDLRPMVLDVVVANPSSDAVNQGSAGMFYPAGQAQAAAEMLGVACHAEAATTLMPAIREQMFKM